METAYLTYLNETKVLHERRGFFSSFTTTSTRMDEAGKHLARISAPLLDLAERLMRHQNAAFRAFLGESQQTLDSFQRLIKLSLVLLLLLAVCVVILVYRGMIAPLRLQLSESQAIIARQEKLAALGGLAAGVAHEIRNPLTAIKFRLFSLKKALPPDLADNEDAAIIADEISRLERIVREFLEFARPSEPETAKVSAQRLLDEVSRLTQAQLEQANIKLEVPSANGLWLAIDFQQIKQVLINLIRNAAESIEDHGTVTLRAQLGHALLGGTSQPVAVIEVADTGRGIPPEVGERLFDPFFTTKEGGTGLGLSIAARIVEKHGGELRYESQLDQGTTFRVVLPAIPENESETPAH
jgi:signal transduction histidine kinase